MAFATKDVCGRVTVIWIGVFIFVAVGWEHTVANMFFLPLGLMYGAATDFGTCLYRNIFLVTLGNFCGGTLFVAGLFGFFYGHFTPMQTETALLLSSDDGVPENMAQGDKAFIGMHRMSTVEAIELDAITKYNF